MTSAPRVDQEIGHEPARAGKSLAAGVVALRWAALAWMILGNLVEGRFERPALAAIALVAATGWTVFVTIERARRSTAIAVIDLALSLVIIALSGIVVPEQTVLGERLFFAATYPIGTALAWGVHFGPIGGIASTIALGSALFISRPLNGFPIGELSAGDLGLVANGMVAYLLAGIAGGVTAAVLDRWAAESEVLLDETMRARENAATFAERERIARQIHDSVLQSLAMVEKRGRELAEQASVPGAEVAALARMASEQERALRSLIMRAPDRAPTGTVSLRAGLEALAASMTTPTEVSTVGPVHIDAAIASEVLAAVKQALANVDEHAGATKANVFASLEGTDLVVSIRDDGRGFVHDLASLAAAGKAGLSKSVIGRIEHLGGAATVDTSAGRGTEIALRVPIGP